MSGKAPVKKGVLDDTSESSYYLFLEAQLQRNNGKFEKATEYLQKAIAADRESEYLKIELATILIRRNKERDALIILEKIIDENPNNVEAMILFGRLKQKEKDIEAAKKAYEHIIAKDPNHEDIYMVLGNIYMQETDYVNALRVYKQLIEYLPGSYAGHFFMGKVFLAQKKFKDAEIHLRKSIEIEPRLEEARFELIEIYKDQDRSDKIIAIYKDMLKKDSSNIRANLELAIFYHGIGAYDDASALFKKLGKQSRTNPQIVSLIFKRYLEKSKYDTVIKITKEMLEVDPENSGLHYIAGLAYEGKKNNKLTMMHLKQVKPESRFYEKAVIHRAFMHQENGEINTAIKVLKTSIKIHPDNPEFRLYLGTFYEELEAYETAVNELKIGINIAPKHVHLHFRLGVVYDKWNRKEESIREMKKVIELDPKHASALNYLGYTWADMGQNLEEAEAYIRRALEIKPDDGYIIDSLGWVYYKNGLFNDAVMWLIRAASLVPDDPIILEHVGDAYRKLGQTEKALEYYKRAILKKKEDKEALEKKIRSLPEKKTLE